MTVKQSRCIDQRQIDGKIYSKRSVKIMLIEMMNYNISYRHTRKFVYGESDLVWGFVLSCILFCIA